MKSKSVRLNDEQAKLIGKKVKEPSENDGKRNPRYYCKPHELVTLGLADPEEDFEGDVPTASDISLTEWCQHYGIEEENVATAKLVHKRGEPYWEVTQRFDKVEEEVSEETIQGIRTALKASIRRRKIPVVLPQNSKVINLVISDIHLGAYIDDGIINPEFSFDTVVKQFQDIYVEANRKGAKKVNVLILGDIIESFTGLNHINSWKGMAKGMHGANIVKLATELLVDGLLSKINNLGEVVVMGSNHDRITSNSKEDTEGGAGDIIAWAAGLMLGIKVTFSPYVHNLVEGNISFVLTHGHLGLSKRSAEYLILNYGQQEKFNLILEGHLHSRIQKAAKVDIVSADSANYRRITAPSLFTGNSYAETLGFTTTAGFLIVEESKSGKVNVFDYSL